MKLQNDKPSFDFQAQFLLFFVFYFYFYVPLVCFDFVQNENYSATESHFYPCIMQSFQNLSYLRLMLEAMIFHSCNLQRNCVILAEKLKKIKTLCQFYYYETQITSEVFLEKISDTCNDKKFRQFHHSLISALNWENKLV